MNRNESREILGYLRRIEESINGPAGREPGTGTAVPLSDRIDKLDNRVSEVQLGLATLAADTKAGFDRVDERFAEVDKRFDAADKRFDAVDKRLDAVDKRLDAVDKRLDAVDKRFAVVDRSIESARVEIVDLVTRVHDELTGRVIDLEVPGSGGKGSGGRGTGGATPP